ncbi:MAG: L-threonylcarbamoyladenylate synthase, partial [Burkholderiaceae bacterium]
MSNGAVSVTRDVLACAEHVAAGGLLGLPTETVYGLAADAQNDAAVQAVFALKGRPADHPLIVHVAPDVAGAEPGWSFFALQAPDWAQALMQAFWPGPLTLVLPRRPGVAGVMAAHLPTVAVRCPAHPLAQQVLVAARARGVMGLAAPSANRFGRISPTLPSHVVDEFAAHTTGAVLRVLDGGPSQVGIESTIVDASRDHPVLLRPGMIERTSLEAVLGRPLASADGNAPRVS